MSSNMSVADREQLAQEKLRIRQMKRRMVEMDEQTQFLEEEKRIQKEIER